MSQISSKLALQALKTMNNIAVPFKETMQKLSKATTSPTIALIKGSILSGTAEATAHATKTYLELLEKDTVKTGIDNITFLINGFWKMAGSDVAVKSIERIFRSVIPMLGAINTILMIIGKVQDGFMDWLISVGIATQDVPDVPVGGINTGGNQTTEGMTLDWSQGPMTYEGFYADYPIAGWIPMNIKVKGGSTNIGGIGGKPDMAIVTTKTIYINPEVSNEGFAWIIYQFEMETPSATSYQIHQGNPYILVGYENESTHWTMWGATK